MTIHIFHSHTSHIEPLIIEKNTLYFLFPWLTYILPSLTYSTFIYQVPTISQDILGTKVRLLTKQGSLSEHLHSSEEGRGVNKQ